MVDAQNVQGRDHVWAGADRKAWMRNDGYIYAGNMVDAQNVQVNRNFVNRSDSRAKNNIKPLTLEDYQKLNDIQPVSFTWKHNPGGEKQSGFIAQNVEKVYPHLVTENKEYKNLNYLGLMPMIVGNLQQVNQYINPKEKQICIEDVCLTKDDLAAVKKGTSLMKNT